MITISYNQGDMSLNTAVALGKQMIQHRAVGAECRIYQQSSHTLVVVTLVLMADLTIDEDIKASPLPSK